jgi:Holliday junction DNA helicase RuvA
MIASVTGTVLVRRPDHVVVEAAGVGYLLNVSAETLGAVPAVGKKATLHSHLVVREDQMSLYGFATEAELDLFQLLIGVNSVGPKVAIAALSGGPVRELVSAIAGGDVKRFQAVPGIGKKTAERIILDLRDKVAGEISGEDIEIHRGEDRSPRSEARDGLLHLGYTPQETEKLLDSVDGESAEELIQAALRAGAQAGAK